MKQGKILLVAAALTALFCLAMNAAAYAQQPSPPEVQALRQRVLIELNGNIQCATNMVDLQQQLAKSTEEVKRLTDKYEPVKKPEVKN